MFRQFSVCQITVTFELSSSGPVWSKSSSKNLFVVLSIRYDHFIVMLHLFVNPKNQTNKMEISWLCFKSNRQKQEVLEPLLPQDYSYKVDFFDLTEPIASMSVRAGVIITTLCHRDRHGGKMLLHGNGVRVKTDGETV